VTCVPACGECEVCNEVGGEFVCQSCGDAGLCCNGSGQCVADCGTCQVCDGQTDTCQSCTEAGLCCNEAGVCGECPPVECAGFCDNQETCNAFGQNCVCRTLDEECGACIEDNQPAGSAAECCSGDFCRRDGVCGLCPPAPGPGPSPAAICPPDYTGNAKSPCNGSCPCSKGRKCQKGRCCEKKGTHCNSGKECCSGKCRRIHDNHKQCA
jgi:hypothetical protein